MARLKPLRIGVIADTHGLFDPAIYRHFRGVDRIIHAGDIGHRSVIARLARIAPVIAVSGNVDDRKVTRCGPETVVELAGTRVAVRHIIYERGKIRKDAAAFLARVRADICIFGHTHQPKIARVGDVLLLNPGSAGPKRFSLPRGIALLSLGKTSCRARLIRLADRAAAA
ncbi:MAG TPA: metallophosphoesterase family protein [Nitrospira sp.]|nr:metallophosphoesterase family protein [Nitrospira sp.]